MNKRRGGRGQGEGGEGARGGEGEEEEKGEWEERKEGGKEDKDLCLVHEDVWRERDEMTYFQDRQETNGLYAIAVSDLGCLRREIFRQLNLYLST